MIWGCSKVTQSGKNGQKNSNKKILNIGPNETGKWVVEVSSSHPEVLSGALLWYLPTTRNIQLSSDKMNFDL